MKKLNQFGALVLGICFAFTSCGDKKNPDNGNGASTTALPPYLVQLVEYVNPKLPNLHAFTHGIYKDKIVMFGGRRRGLHGSLYNFSQGAANKIIYVVDTKNWDANPANWEVYSQADSLTVPPSLITPSANANAGQLRANNAEFFSQNNMLYVIGGLIGATSTNTNSINGGPFTIPYMTAINLPNLINAVINQTTVAAGSVYQAEDPRLALTGGEISVNGNQVTTIFGWNVYNPVQGLYSHKISTFNFTDSGSSLSISNYSTCATCFDGVDSSGNLGNLRRRDGTVSPIIDPASGSQNTMFFGGVFKYGVTNFTDLVWLRNDSAVVVDSSFFNLRGNVYTCQSIPFYSKLRNESYTTLLGGMTNSSYSTNGVKYPVLLTNSNSTITPADTVNFLSVPFSNKFTTIKIDKNRNIWQFLLPDSFPPTASTINIPSFPSKSADTSYVLPAGSSPKNGAESEIFWTYNPKYNMGNGVIDLDAFLVEHPTGGTVGYHFGGILSVVNNVNMNNQTNKQVKFTIASNRLFAIKVTPYILRESEESK